MDSTAKHGGHAVGTAGKAGAEGRASSLIRGVPSEVVLNEDDGMKFPCAVNLHGAITVRQDRLGSLLAQLRPERMEQVCAALRFALGCDAG